MISDSFCGSTLVLLMGLSRSRYLFKIYSFEITHQLNKMYNLCSYCKQNAENVYLNESQAHPQRNSNLQELMKKNLF